MTTMTFTEQLITIAVVVLGTMTTRFLPFLIFPANKKTPPLVDFLGKVLPAAVMAMLVVYSLRNTSVTGSTHGLPELIASLVTIALQVFTRNMLLAIASGTISYMYLVQVVFR